MLEIRTNCENCNASLPNESKEAMICTFECTFCKSCVEEVLKNVCPNCTGGFEKRPVRPKSYMDKYPVSEKVVLKPVDLQQFATILKTYKDIPPENR